MADADNPRPLELQVELERCRAALFGGEVAPVALGRFRIVERLGAGAMGVVFRARDPELDRDVAVKLVGDATATAEQRARMRREAKAMARLNHPNVVVIYEVGEHEGRLFIAMELVEGSNLRQWLDARQRTTEEIVAVLRDVASGVAAAHRTGLVHRDIKPENILVDAEGRARIADFGVAGTRDVEPVDDVAPSSMHLMTATGVRLGTPAYMAPEVLRGEPADARSDQFSFCVSAYEALHGRRPFDAATLDELVKAVEEGPAATASSGRAIPRAVNGALGKGLAFEPDARHPSMDEIVGALAGTETSGRAPWAGLAFVGAIALGAVGLWALARSDAETGKPRPTVTATASATASAAPKPSALSAGRPFDRAAAQALLARNAAEAAQCRRGDDPKGPVNTMVWFNPAGHIDSVAMSNDSAYSAATGACLASVMAQGKIPAFDDDPTILRWPVVLE